MIQPLTEAEELDAWSKAFVASNGPIIVPEYLYKVLKKMKCNMEYYIKQENIPTSYEEDE